MKRALCLVSPSFLLLALVTPACSDDADGTAPPPSGSDGGTEAGTEAGTDASNDVQDAGTDTIVPLDATLDGTLDYGCSGDLRSVIDANGDVVEVCSSDQGCLDGTCIEACQAAAGSRGNVGCEFFVPTPEGYATALPPCFAMFVANTWPRPARLTVTRGTASLDVTQFARIPQNGQPESAWPTVPATGIPQDGVAVLFLSHDPSSVLPETGAPLSCPVAPAVEVGTTVGGTGIGEAFHVESDTPISAYDILPYGGAHSHVPSAGLLYPTSAWGDNYVVVATPPGTYATPGLWGQVLASEDDTTIQLLPSVALPAGATFSAAPTGEMTEFTISRGEYLQWVLPAGSADLSGSVVASDKPVAVFAGAQLFRLQPETKPGGDASHEQNVAVGALGFDYAAAPYETRREDLAPEDIPYRLVGIVDGTTLTYDPPVTGAPTVLDQGQVAEFSSTQAFRVTSQDADHPFAIAQMMNSAYWIGVGEVREGATAPGWDMMLGDEEFVSLLPPAQFLKHYVFFTDPTYPTTNLVLTRVKTAQGFQDVDVDCIGTISGWKPVGTSGELEMATVDLLRAGVPVGACENGRHEASSDGPFGIVVWGLDSYSSYAYPAGGNAAQLTTMVVPAVPK